MSAVPGRNDVRVVLDVTPQKWGLFSIAEIGATIARLVSRGDVVSVRASRSALEVEVPAPASGERDVLSVLRDELLAQATPPAKPCSACGGTRPHAATDPCPLCGAPADG